jgi:chromosomal replication initiator protein
MANHEFPFTHFLNPITTNEQVTLENNISSTFNAEKKEIIENEDYGQETKSSKGFSVEELRFINHEILNLLKMNIAPQKFETYFDSNFTLVQIKKNHVIFNVATNFIKNIIENQFLDFLQQSLKEVLGNKEFKISIIINNEIASAQSTTTNFINTLERVTEESLVNRRSVKENTFTLDLSPTKEDLITSVESKYINHMENNYDESNIDPSKTFSNFIIGHSNQLAVASAIAVARNPGKSGKYPSLYIHSNSGLGKTHLLNAVANGINEQFPHLRICLITARNFLKEMVEYIKDNNIEQFQRKYSEKVDVLMIDDIHELKNKKGTQDEFFHIFNELYNKGKQLIFTSDKAPSEIDGIPERIKTRLQWGLVIDIQKPDIETRIAILKKKALGLDLYLSDDILTSIATSIRSNIRELEGSLIKLSAFSDVMKMDIDMEMVKDILKLSNYEEAKTITLEEIAKITSSHYRIPVTDLKSKARSKEITKARHIAMYLSRKIIHCTQQEIGKFFGGRDHTSVIHALNKITAQLKIDVGLSRDIIQIENNL